MSLVLEYKTERETVSSVQCPVAAADMSRAHELKKEISDGVVDRRMSASKIDSIWS